MDFAWSDMDLSEDQRALRATLREFAEAEIAPHAAEWDRTGSFPAEAVRKLGQLGVMGLPFPEEYGGVGAGSLSMAVAIEELARIDSSVAITVAASVSLAGWPLLAFGTEAQKQRWLVPIARGEALGAFASTESGSGSDVRGIQTTAREEQGQWVLNGSKAYITNAGTELSSLTIALCVTGERDSGDREITNVLVPTATPGFVPQKPYRKMGWHASDTRELVFEDCRVPIENMLGERGAGVRQFLATLDGGRIGVGALGVGLAQGCLELSVEWARARSAFGQPISRFQAVAFQLAELQVQVDAARAMVHRAARLRDSGAPFTRPAAEAKLFASEVAVKAADVAMQVHGGFGFIEESPVARHYRDAKILTIGEGTSEILKLVIARGMGLEV